MARAKSCLIKGGCACSASNASSPAQWGGGGSSNTSRVTVVLLAGTVVILIIALVWVIAKRKGELRCEEKGPSCSMSSRQSLQSQSSQSHGMNSQPSSAGALQDVKPNKLPSYFSSEYQQVGILTSPTERDGGDPMILPLFGKRMDRHDRWQYYAAGEKPQHLWRVSVHVNGRECEETVGCSEIQHGDNVQVPVYATRSFVASMYKLDAPKYFADKY